MNRVMRADRESRQALFTSLYNQSFDYVYSYVFARTAGSRQLTEDIVQDTFAAAWLSLGLFRHGSSWRTWLCSIAKNKLRESYRKTTCREKFEIADSPSLDGQASDTDLEEIAFNHETQRCVLNVLEELNPLYRYVLIMKYMDGMRVKGIAGVLGRSPKAVDGILLRAKCGFRTTYCKLEGRDQNEER